MSGSMTLEDRIEQVMKENAEKEAQIEYLRRQLKQAMKRNRKELQSSSSSTRSHSVEGEEEPIVSIKETHTHESNKVNFDLPPKFDEYEENEKETTEEEEKEKEMEGSTMEEPLKEGGVLLSFLEPILKDEPSKPHVDVGKLENLRANSFLEGEDDAHVEGQQEDPKGSPNPQNLKSSNDAPMGGILDQNKENPSNQESKTLNQEAKAVIPLFKAPRAVVEAVAKSGGQFVFDPGKGQLC